MFVMNFVDVCLQTRISSFQGSLRIVAAQRAGHESLESSLPGNVPRKFACVPPNGGDDLIARVRIRIGVANSIIRPERWYF
jgi:hypothetical protein